MTTTCFQKTYVSYKFSMRKLLILSLITIVTHGDVAIDGDFAFEWKSSLLFPNGTVVQACVGYNVMLPWLLDMTSPKQVSVEWSKTSEDVPVTTSVEWHAFIFPEKVYNSTTGLWHVQLGCRPPLTQGQSALPVIWTTPSSRTVISTSYNNNTFILELPLPVEEGDYSCSLNKSVPAVKCLSTLLNTSRAATVSVKGVNTRLSYLEGSVETLLKETADLNASLCHLTDIVQQLQSKDKKCDEEIIHLNQTTEKNNSVLQNLQTPNKKMSGKLNCLESITATAQINYDNISVMVLNKFDNLTDLIQTKNGSMAALVQNKFDDIAALVQSKFDSISDMVHSHNDSISSMVQSKFDNISAMVQSKFDDITAMVQSKFDNIPAPVQSKFDDITAMVQSKFDNITAMVQSKFDDTTAMVQSNNNIPAPVQSKFDDITAMVQSKFDKVTAIVLQLQSAIIQPHNTDSVQQPASCVDIQKYDKASGVRTINVSNKSIKVYCDQSTDNGGWTVIQRRQDGSVDFYRNWEQYEMGFGDLNGEFWIGLANLHLLTKSKSFKLRVDLTDFNSSRVYAIYNTFNISGRNGNYRLNVGRYNGTAGDSLAFHNKMQFSTFDRDHDKWGSNCAKIWHGAWWYAACHNSNLNGRYKSDGAFGADGVNWYYWKSDWRSFKRVEMKIKQ